MGSCSFLEELGIFGFCRRSLGVLELGMGRMLHEASFRRHISMNCLISETSRGIVGDRREAWGGGGFGPTLWLLSRCVSLGGFGVF